MTNDGCVVDLLVCRKSSGWGFPLSQLEWPHKDMIRIFNFFHVFIKRSHDCSSSIHNSKPARKLQVFQIPFHLLKLQLNSNPFLWLLCPRVLLWFFFHTPETCHLQNYRCIWFVFKLG